MHSITEALARTKECPIPSRGLCSGSRCIAWAVTSSYPHSFAISVANQLATTEPSRPNSVPATWKWCPYDPADGDPAGWLEPTAENSARQVGRCTMCGPIWVPA